jgi:hypothetical protein
LAGAATTFAVVRIDWPNVLLHLRCAFTAYALTKKARSKYVQVVAENEDYAWTRPALLQWKLRELELKAGHGCVNDSARMLVANAAKSDTILGWYRKLGPQVRWVEGAQEVWSIASRLLRRAAGSAHG